jgi:hypothetical protein
MTSFAPQLGSTGQALKCFLFVSAKMCVMKRRKIYIAGFAHGYILFEDTGEPSSFAPGVPLFFCFAEEGEPQAPTGWSRPSGLR